MKKIMILGLLALVLAFATTPVGATPYTINSGAVNVGDVDTLVTSVDPTNYPNPADVNSGDANELAWVNGVLGMLFTATDMTKNDTPDGFGWIKTDQDPTVYAYGFQTINPQYFFVKVGSGQQKIDHYLFKNETELGWAVIDIDAQDPKIKNSGAFSHIGEFGSTAVPEPATLFLLGSGLVGLVVIRRKKR